MKIAVLTSGILPVPAVLGGAVENLIDYYLEYNNDHQLHDITVYSIAPPKGTPKADTSHTHYHYIDTTSWWGRLKRHLYVRTHKANYYNQYIEYFFYEALKDIARKEYDMIILENRPGYAIPVSEVSKAKIIIHLHNDLLNKDSKNAIEICKVCDKVITVSDYIKGRVETIQSNIPITTVYNGIDLERFYNAKPIDRKKMGFKEDDFIVVYSGRLIKEKGIEELIDAFILLKDYPQIKLLILGGSFYGVGNNQNSFLKTLIEKSNPIKDSIVFTGFVPYEQLPQYLKVGDVAVVPSIWEEPFGLTCVEAMAAGLPLIATNSGAIPEICMKYAIIINRNNIVNDLYKSIIKSHKIKVTRYISTDISDYINETYAKKIYSSIYYHTINGYGE